MTQVLPYPPDSGGKIKTFNLLRYLSQRHDVILASLIRSPAEMRLVDGLRPYCRRIETAMLHRSRFRDGLALLSGLLQGRPFLIQRDFIPEMQELVHKLVEAEHPDIIQAVQINMAQYAEGIDGIPRILDQENAVATIVERMYRLDKPGLRKALTYLEWRRLARYEGRMCREFDRVLAVSEEDRQAMARLSGQRARITVIPIGVDCEAVQTVPRRPGTRGILTVGTLHWPPNADGILWFARDVLPLIQREVPGVVFYVVGKNPPEAIQKLQQRASSEFLSEPGLPLDHQQTPVVVTGYVEDLAPYFTRSAVFVVPIRAGGGMRVKILDAWARGIPVVSTRIGCEGIEVRDGTDILIADTANAFAQAVTRLLTDMSLAQQLAIFGRQRAKAKYDWRQLYSALDEEYRNVAGSRSFRSSEDESARKI